MTTISFVKRFYPVTALRVGGSSGFNAKLSAYRGYAGDYSDIDRCGVYWSLIVCTGDHSYIRTILHNQANISRIGCEISGANSV